MPSSNDAKLYEAQNKLITSGRLGLRSDKQLTEFNEEKF